MVPSSRVRLVARGDVPGSDGGIYNPGAIATDSSIFMLCRREVDYEFSNQVYPEAFHLDPTSLEVLNHRTLEKRNYPAESRIEDFRCIRFGGELLVVHTIVCRDRIKPMISRVTGDYIEPYDDFDLPFQTMPVEKNWVLFVHDGDLHCLYQLDPLIILRRDAPCCWRLVANQANGWADTHEHLIGNSANLIQFMGGYLGFWHTQIEGRYVQGAYLLGQDLSIRCATGVLLDGAEVVSGYKPGVLYVSSLIQSNGKVYAFYGEGDAHTSVATFDGRELERKLAASVFVPAVPLSIWFECDSMGDLFRGMQALQEFSRRRNDPAIRLHVRRTDFGPALARFGMSNVKVFPLQIEVPEYFDYFLFGRAGFLVSLRGVNN